MRGFLKNMGVLCVALGLSVLALEGLSRLVYPVQYGHKSFALDGRPVYPATDFLGVVPSLTYRQRAEEFDVLTTHTARGFRGPVGGFMDVPDPEILFVGDSMTYGVGLADDQTIPSLYCHAAGQTCANLGRPGIGTVEAVNIIEHRIVDQGWRPLDVKLLMNVMTTAQFGGNDLTDNLNARAQIAPSPGTAGEKIEPLATPAPAAAPVFSRAAVMEHSNLARLGYYVLAPLARRLMSPAMEAEFKQRALALTEDELARLERLSRRYGFTYTIYILHPMQDLTRQTWQQTRTDIQAIAGSARLVDTAPALLDTENPVDYYYPLDGHVRPEGAAKIAAYMLARDTED